MNKDHWVLAYYEAKTNTLSIKDSYIQKTSNIHHKMYIETIGTLLNSRNIEFETHETKFVKQNNTYDCGVIICKFILHLYFNASPLNFTWNEEESLTVRALIYCMLHQFTLSFKDIFLSQDSLNSLNYPNCLTHQVLDAFVDQLNSNQDATYCLKSWYFQWFKDNTINKCTETLNRDRVNLTSFQNILIPALILIQTKNPYYHCQLLSVCKNQKTIFIFDTSSDRKQAQLGNLNYFLHLQFGFEFKTCIVTTISPVKNQYDSLLSVCHIMNLIKSGVRPYNAQFTWNEDQSKLTRNDIMQALNINSQLDLSPIINKLHLSFKMQKDTNQHIMKEQEIAVSDADTDIHTGEAKDIVKTVDECFNDDWTRLPSDKAKIMTQCKRIKLQRKRFFKLQNKIISKINKIENRLEACEKENKQIKDQVNNITKQLSNTSNFLYDIIYKELHGLGYQNVKFFRESTFGRVFTAQKGLPVAIKIITPQLYNQNEYTTLKLLHSMNEVNNAFVVKVFSLIDHKHFKGIEMEFLPFGLRTYIKGKNLQTKRQICNNILRGIHAGHARDVYHNDIKMANIRVSHDGTAKVCDWGLANQSFRAGTQKYKSPEVFTIADIDPYKMDAWAAGLVLYEIIEGKEALDDIQLKEIQNRRIDGIDIKFSTKDKQAQDLINKLLQLDWTKRITVGQAICHDWFKGVTTIAPEQIFK